MRWLIEWLRKNLHIIFAIIALIIPLIYVFFAHHKYLSYTTIKHPDGTKTQVAEWVSEEDYGRVHEKYP